MRIIESKKSNQNQISSNNKIKDLSTQNEPSINTNQDLPSEEKKNTKI